MGCINSNVKTLSTPKAKLHQCFASWLLPGSGIIGGLALTAACRDLTTDISQPLVNTLLSPGSICSPFLCPLAPIMKPRTSHLKYSLSLTFSSPWALHGYRLRVYFQGRDLRGFDNRSWRIHASISHVFLPPFNFHETPQPWNAMYTSKQQRRKRVKVMWSV